MDELLLPQNEIRSDSKASREAQLSATRKFYGYKWFADILPQNIGGPVPGLDTAGPAWVRNILKVLYGIRANVDKTLQSKKYTFTNDSTPMPSAMIAELIRTLQTSKLTGYYAFDPGPLTGLAKSSKVTIEDYKNLFSITKMPDFVKRNEALSDEIFSRSFIAGANPAMIKRLESIPENFVLTTAHLRSADQGRDKKYFAADTIEKAIAEGRVFIADYSDMSGLRPGTHSPGIKKYVYGTIAAFAVPPMSYGEARPFSVFAIKGGQSNDSLIFTPKDDWSWMIAKGMVNASHYTYHETINHLGWTHLVMEPVVISLRRQLATKHPIYKLLSPHFEGTRAINDLAYSSLIQPGAAVDRLIGADLNDIHQYLSKQRLGFNFSEHYLPNRMRKLKLDTASGADIPEYPYRDDALLLWNAILTWATSYVNTYYTSDADILADYEIQNWAKEVSDPTVNQGGALKGFGTNGQITSRKELAEICTMTIFTSGPQHAAVNFSQRTDMIYLPATPLAGYIPEIKTTGHKEEDFLKFLPPIDVAMVQVSMLELLGGVFYTNIGRYNPGYFDNPQVLAALTKLGQDMDKIEIQIADRNKKGTRLKHPYITLLPSRVPQSINI